MTAMRASAWAIWTAPTTIRRRGGFQTSTNNLPCGASIVWLRSSITARLMAARSSLPSLRSPSAMPSPNNTCAPLASAVTRTVVRPACCSASRRSSRSIFTLRPSRQPLDEDLHLAAAGEADVPGLLVGHAEIEQLRLARADGVECALDYGAFDAAAGDGADEAALVVDRQLGADRPGRGAPGGDDGGERHAAPGPVPLGRFAQDLVGIAHGGRFLQAALLAGVVRHSVAASSRRPAGRLNASIRLARLSRLCTGRNSSTWGRIAFMPNDLGSKAS